jgi:hypothetical protein
MERVRGILILAGWVTMAGGLPVLSSSALACSRGFPTYEVTNDFMVSVTNHGKPLTGVEVKVLREVKQPSFHFENAFWDATDANGEVSVRGLAAGRYFITVMHADVESEQAGELEVGSKSSSARSRLTLEWPAHTVFPIQNLAGVVAADRGLFPLPGAVLLLVDATSGRQIGATVADQKGRFEFRGWVDPGLYILRISAQGVEKRAGALLSGSIFVRLDTEAKDKELPRLGLTMSSCGMSGYREDNTMVVF